MEKVTEFGINPDNVFQWDWVGGRFHYGVPLD
jgi:glucose-6-phosphate isomerase